MKSLPNSISLIAFRKNVFCLSCSCCPSPVVCAAAPPQLSHSAGVCCLPRVTLDVCVSNTRGPRAHHGGSHRIRTQLLLLSSVRVLHGLFLHLFVTWLRQTLCPPRSLLCVLARSTPVLSAVSVLLIDVVSPRNGSASQPCSLVPGWCTRGADVLGRILQKTPSCPSTASWVTCAAPWGPSCPHSFTCRWLLKIQFTFIC